MTPAGIIATAQSDDQHRTICRRVALWAANLAVVDANSALSVPLACDGRHARWLDIQCRGRYDDGRMGSSQPA